MDQNARHTWRSSRTRDQVLSAMCNYPAIIFFDTETTGLSAAKGDRVIELAAQRFRVAKGISLEYVDSLHLYMKPPFAISEKITGITGITNDFLADKPDYEEVFPEIYGYFGEHPVVCGHNSPFDVGFMACMYEMFEKTFVPEETLDTLEMARDNLAPEDTENYKLGTVASLYGADKDLNFHSAMDDTTAAERLFEIFCKEYEESFLQATESKGIVPEVFSVAYWEHPANKKLKRIYVETSLGTVYFDLMTKTWRSKDADMSQIDMEAVEAAAWKTAAADSVKSFCRFRDKVRLTA